MNLNEPIGDPRLCAWAPAPGVVWVQTRDPWAARQLERRSDSRRVLAGVAGGFLRTFEFRHSLAWARRLVKRYMSGELYTNEGFSSLDCPQTSPNARRDRGQRTPRKAAQKSKSHA